MLSSNLYKLAKYLKKAILTPSMEGVREDYNVPWEFLTTIIQSVEEDYKGKTPLNPQELKHNLKLPSEVIKERFPLPRPRMSIGDLHNLAQIHRTLSFEKGTIHFFAGLGILENSDLGFWVYVAFAGEIMSIDRWSIEFNLDSKINLDNYPNAKRDIFSSNNTRSDTASNQDYILLVFKLEPKESTTSQ